jgi:hypothetical protein
MKIKLWSDSAEGWFEKGFSAFCKIGIAFLYLYMQFSAWQICHNFYQQNVKAAPGGWHFLGFILSVVSVFWFFSVATDKNYVTKSDVANVIIGGALVAVSFCTYAGFVFNIG